MGKIKDPGLGRSVKAVCLSEYKGPKSEVKAVVLVKDLGIKGDFHAKGGERQVSLLASESIARMRDKGLKIENGAFGENIITGGTNLVSLKIGQRLKIGEAEIEITKIGKKCLERCEIYYKTGDCVMPREGVFAQVIKGGKVKAGDYLEVLK